MVTLIFLRGLCGYVRVNILTLSPLRIYWDFTLENRDPVLLLPYMSLHYTEISFVSASFLYIFCHIILSSSIHFLSVFLCVSFCIRTQWHCAQWRVGNILHRSNWMNIASHRNPLITFWVYMLLQTDKRTNITKKRGYVVKPFHTRQMRLPLPFHACTLPITLLLRMCSVNL